MTKTFIINSKATNVVLAIMFQIFIAMFIMNNVYASGQGQVLYLENGGDVFVKVIDNPGNHDAREWGYVDEATQTDVTVGVATEGEVFNLGYFDEESEITFWGQGKNKRFYTGKGNCQTTDTQFVINGVKFEWYVEEGNSEMAGVSRAIVEEVVVGDNGADDCSDPNVDYIQGNLVKLERFYKSSNSLEVLRVVMNVKSDWTRYSDDDCTAEITLNDSCAYTVSATDEIGYFIIESKQYEGRKLTSYDFPEGVSYLGKLRITSENGVSKMYVYINNMDISELVGSSVNVKVRLIQGGEIVEAYEATKTMSEKIK